MPCYAAHGTHVYQGLDVVVFGPLKCAYGKERDRHLRETGEAITKLNFLKVYGETHLKIITSDLIKTAFRKTGIYPFNRKVITPEMMAPSRDTSYKIFTPIIPPTPVQIVTDLLIDAIQPSVDPKLNQPSHEIGIEPILPVRLAIPQLASSDICFLTSQSPVKSTMELPNFPTMELSPVKLVAKAEGVDLSKAVPKTKLEKLLHEALVAKSAEADFFRGCTIQLQASMVLQRLYCTRVRRQLQAKEVKMNAKKAKGRLHGDGLPRVLTDDEFFERVVAHFKALEEEEVEREAKKQNKEDLNAEIDEWKRNEEQRKKTNLELQANWETADRAWKVEKDRIKLAGGKIKDWTNENPKPKKSDPQFKQEKAVLKPKLKRVAVTGIEGSDEEEIVSDWSDEEEL